MCHENEKGIYGDTPVRCLDLLETFAGRLGCVFDPANFLQVGADPFPDAFMSLQSYITYMHIKDCVRNGTIVVAGKGVGSIPEIFALLNRTVDDDMIVTVEPHLKVFDGLSALEGGEKTKIQNNTFATNEEAFCAAIAGARMCMPRTAILK